MKAVNIIARLHQQAANLAVIHTELGFLHEEIRNFSPATEHSENENQLLEELNSARSEILRALWSLGTVVSEFPNS